LAGQQQVGDVYRPVAGAYLTAGQRDAHNTFADPDVVKERPFDQFKADGHKVTLNVPPMSVVTFVGIGNRSMSTRRIRGTAAENAVDSYVNYFTVDKALQGKPLYISFQAVESAFYLWLNGKFIGYSEDSFAPAEIGLTDAVVPGVNRLAVEVFRRSTGSWLEDQDFWRFSGVFRDVYLYATPSTRHTDLDADFRHAELTVEGDRSGSGLLAGLTNGRGSLRLFVRLTDLDCSIIFRYLYFCPCQLMLM
jgi:hypothetical protein